MRQRGSTRQSKSWWISTVFALCAWILIAQVCNVEGVDRSKFRKCDQTAFCAKHRVQEGPKSFTLVAKSCKISANSEAFYFQVQNKLTPNEPLHGEVTFLKSNAVRMRIREQTFEAVEVSNEANQMDLPRWQPKDVLVDTERVKCNLLAHKDVSKSIVLQAQDIILKADNGQNAALVLRSGVDAFKMEVYIDNVLALSSNTFGKMHYDVRNDKSTVEDDKTVDTGAAVKDVHGGKEIVDYGEDGLAIYSDGSVQEKGTEDDQKKDNANTATDSTKPATSDESVWEESFGGHKDVKKYGATSVGLDINFHGANRELYGIPEHATDFKLKDTSNGAGYLTEPYRMYNLDVFEYELNEPMALYGHIPVMVAPSPQNTVGVFWFNPSETFIDIQTPADSATTKGAAAASKQTHWLSESGIIDLFVFPGQDSKDFFKQYTTLTGKAPLPPLFAIGYHQCRWNYKNENDVYKVNENFDKYLIPYDVLWLDIEHTNGKRYFTWDSHAFPHPVEMQQKLSVVKRKMVTIVDPHIKRDNDYYIHQLATEKKLYVRDENGNDFDGWCWPGSSSYVDFTNPAARRWWSEQFRTENYKQSTLDLYTWNDMNEPSVFNGPEVSMRKNCLNLNNLEHREWHNLYGMYMQKATMEGQILRQLPAKDYSPTVDLPLTDQIERPFVLSRAFFAGSQRFGAIWTGDNTADWGHLKYATKMLLSMSVAGLTFVGADIGGFFGNPDAELLTRWYQSATYQPFFRGHAHHDSSRREPWVFGEPHTARIRQSIRERYAILPYLYTLFYECAAEGMPVMRPMWMHYGKDVKSYGLEDMFLLGSDILVQPIVAANVASVQMYLPAGSLWYAVHDSNKRYVGGQEYTVPSPIEYTPTFQRGGSIIPKRLRVRRSSKLMQNDPYTLVIALDQKMEASGVLYFDDEHTFAYETNQKYSIGQFNFSKNVLSYTLKANKFQTTNYVERIVIIGTMGKTPNSIIVTSTKAVLDFVYNAGDDTITIRKPKVEIGKHWEITLQY